MIDKLATNITCFYLKKDVIPQKEFDSYKYGFEILLSTVINIAIVLGVSVLISSPLEGILFMAAFIVTRSVGGGYHANSHRACIIIFTSVFILFCIFLRILDKEMVVIYCLLSSFISAITIAKIAPVEAINKPLSIRKRKKMESMSLIVASSFMIISLGLYYFSRIPGDMIACLLSGELAAAISMAVGAIINKKEGEHEVIV